MKVEIVCSIFLGTKRIVFVLFSRLSQWKDFLMKGRRVARVAGEWSQCEPGATQMGWRSFGGDGKTRQNVIHAAQEDLFRNIWIYNCKNIFSLMIEVKTLVSYTRLTCVTIFTNYLIVFWSVHKSINQNLESGFNVGIILGGISR